MLKEQTSSGSPKHSEEARSRVTKLSFIFGVLIRRFNGLSWESAFSDLKFRAVP